VLQDADDVRTTNRTLVDQQEQAVIQADTADGRQMVAAERHPQDGRLRARGVGTDDSRQQIEAGLVYPDDGLAGALRPLLSAGQRWAYQAAMASSFRWVARAMGFCGLQPFLREAKIVVRDAKHALPGDKHTLSLERCLVLDSPACTRPASRLVVG
jgi:hypothetical protein